MVILNRYNFITMSRIGILSFNQDSVDKIYRFTSGTLAAQYCKAGTHVRISKKVIRELVPDVTPSSDPDRYCHPPVEYSTIPEPINPPGPQATLVLAYPVADQSSYAKRDFRLMWGCCKEEWQKKIGSHV